MSEDSSTKVSPSLEYFREVVRKGPAGADLAETPQQSHTILEIRLSDALAYVHELEKVLEEKDQEIHTLKSILKSSDESRNHFHNNAEYWYLQYTDLHKRHLILQKSFEEALNKLDKR